MIKIAIGQVWRATRSVTEGPDPHPLFIIKSSYTRDGERLAYQRIQPDDKILIKDIDDESTWITSPTGASPIFMVRVIHNGIEYRVANMFLHTYFTIDEQDLQETT